VLSEFDRITERGGVLGAMETMYQRSRIQEESLYYETLKHTGEYPIIGVNTFLSSKGSPTVLPKEVIRATEEEKEAQIATVENCARPIAKKRQAALRKLRGGDPNENMFAVEATKYCSLGRLRGDVRVGSTDEYIGRWACRFKVQVRSYSRSFVAAGTCSPLTRVPASD
jgi:methylmalonyl-CoA mutase